MRKSRILPLLAALLLLFSACSQRGTTYLFDNGEHTHVFGGWYDVTPVTCLEEGVQVCYCKICAASYTEPVPVLTDIALRAHVFQDTVTPPTEAQDGYTRRVCTLCGYVVERTDEVYALYRLPMPFEEFRTEAGALAQLIFSTHRATPAGERFGAVWNPNAAVSAAPALYLCTALVGAEAVAAGEIALTDTVTLTRQMLTGENTGRFREGMEVSVEALLRACMDAGNDAAVAALAARLSGSEAEFLARLNGRLTVLGVENTHFTGLSAPLGETTLADSSILLWRVLEDDVLAQYTDLGFSMGGKPCAAFFETDGFCLSAFRTVDGYEIKGICT